MKKPFAVLRWICRMAALCLLVLTLMLSVACHPAGDGTPEESGRESATADLRDTAAPTSPETIPASNLGTSPETEPETQPEPESEEVTDLPATMEKRYFIYRIWNFNLTAYATFTHTVDTVAAQGFNAIKVHIPWASAQPTADAPDFSAYDRLIDYVVREKGMRVAISLDLTRRMGDALVGEEHIQRDPTGKLCVGGHPGDNRTVISFCSEYAVELAVDFYQAAVAHYHERYGDAVLFYLPAFNPYCETEYWAVGDYDYSPVAKAAFAAFLQEEFGTVEALNQAMGTSYADFASAEPPGTTVQSDEWGLLWYRFRHAKLKSVIDRLARAQETVAPETKFSVQFGSVFDTAIARRGTVAFPALCENVDVLWVDDAPTYAHDWSMDYIRSALPAHVEIANEIDGPQQTGASPENYLDQGLTSYRHGATYVSIANWSVGAQFTAYRSVWREIVDTWLSDDPPPILGCTEGTPVISVSLEQVFKRGTERYAKQYAKESDGGKRFVYLRITDDLTEPTTDE